MNRPPAETVRCAGPPALRRRWYRSLAYALAATPLPGGVVFEATVARPLPWVTIRPASLVETVRASPSVRGVLLERRPAPPPLEPPSGGQSEVRSLLPVRSVPAGTRAAEVGREAPDLGLLAGPGGWVGFQTFWIRTRGGAVATARRYRFWSREEFDRRAPAVAVAAAQMWADSTDVSAVPGPVLFGAVRDWRRGSLGSLPGEAWLLRPVDALEGTAEPGSGAEEGPFGLEGHRVVFGASGAGKTTYLARLAARHASERGGLFVVDLHGDLAPAIVARLPPATRARVVAVDTESAPIPGISALPSAGGSDDRAAAHLVAALKRLSPDGTDLHWGFRLERIFDSFVRLVLETGGSLVDLYGLLTDPDRRDAARLATRRADLARFLEELGPVLKRQPDFLWSAATRLSKVVLVRPLTELLAPVDGGLPVEDLVEAGRPVLVRAPFATLGPEAAAFAGTLLVARLYLGLAARRPDGGRRAPILFVLDEAHIFAPRLVAEILTESRKFGLRTLLATQYPERLAPELAGAVGGALTDVVTFRVPQRSARLVGEWVGLPRDVAERWLVRLPTGHGVRLEPETAVPRAVPACERGVAPSFGPWREAVDRTRPEFGIETGPSEATEPDPGGATERLLLAVLAAEEEGRPLGNEEEVLAAADRLPGGQADPTGLGLAVRRAVAERLVASSADGVRLTAAGERRLGLGAPTGAARETDEHRRLLLTTFRLFARRGYRLEIVRQGRFDTTLPDAVFRQLPSGGLRSPHEVGEAIDRARAGWAWRYFGGRDVHVEAEVSGALRPERVRHGYRKAAARRAAVLFVVGDAARARRVRAALHALGVPRDRAHVWTLRVGPGPGPPAPSRDRER